MATWYPPAAPPVLQILMLFTHEIAHDCTLTRQSEHSSGKQRAQKLALDMFKLACPLVW